MPSVYISYRFMNGYLVFYYSLTFTKLQFSHARTTLSVLSYYILLLSAFYAFSHKQYSCRSPGSKLARYSITFNFNVHAEHVCLSIGSLLLFSRRIIHIRKKPIKVGLFF